MFDKLLGEVKGVFNIITIIEMVNALIYFFVGMSFFTNSSLSFRVVSIITGILLIINGAISIYTYFKREDIELFNYNLIFGIILIIVGIVALFMNYFVAIALGIYLIVCGIQNAVYGFILKKFQESSWLTILIIGILLVVLGVVTIFTNPNAVTKVAGICLFGYGIISFINVLLLRRRAKYFIA